jgi:hypothetical protein
MVHLPTDVALQHFVISIADARDPVMSPPKSRKCIPKQVLKTPLYRTHDLSRRSGGLGTEKELPCSMIGKLKVE